jgi:hypothetical protein
MADYDFTLVHKPGKFNHADHLSRHLDYDTGTEDNNNVIVLPEKLFTNATSMVTLEQEVLSTQKEHEEQIKELRALYPLDEVQEQWYY